MIEFETVYDLYCIKHQESQLNSVKSSLKHIEWIFSTILDRLSADIGKRTPHTPTTGWWAPTLTRSPRQASNSKVDILTTKCCKCWSFSMIYMIRSFKEALHSPNRNAFIDCYTISRPDYPTVSIEVAFSWQSIIAFLYNWTGSVIVAYHMTMKYHDVIMSTMASQITGLATVYSTVYSGTD